MTTTKLIICSGDSYTAGDELAGNLLVPGYTSHVYSNTHLEEPNEERKSLHKKLTDAIEQLREKSWHLAEEYENFSKDRAWPKHLEQLSGHTVVNCARGGISNEEIAHRAIETFHKQLDAWNPQDITVIIMPTTKERFGYPVHDSVNGGLYEFQSIMPQYIKHNLKPEVMQYLLEYHVEHMTDYDNLWKSLQHLIAAREYFKSYGSRVMFVDSCLWSWTFDMFEGKKQERVAHMKTLIDVAASMTVFSGKEKEALAGHHFVENVHKIFAQEVNRILNDN